MHLARLAWGRLLEASPGFNSDRIRSKLASFVDETLLDAWLNGLDYDRLATPVHQSVEDIQQTLADGTRRRHGIYLTPRPVAAAMGAVVNGDAGGAVVDLSAGAGTLLAAAIERHPHLRAVGVEQNPVMAIAAAINLASARMRLGHDADRGDRIYLGDGLAADAPWRDLEGRAAAVLGNPPYIREKGNRDLFAALKQAHPHLAEHFVPRMDLQYLFFHRSLSFLGPDARLIFLTTAYWLSATNADEVRRDLVERARPEVLVRVERAGVFSDAPGQHTLLSVFRRAAEVRARAVSLQEAPPDWSALVAELVAPDCAREDVVEPAPEVFGAEPWSPFADAPTARWGARLDAQGTPLAELLRDRQGFVSGADRSTKRHQRYYDTPDEAPPVGTPIFIFEDGAQVPDQLACLAPSVLRPLLRARRLHPNAVFVCPPADDVALYIDEPVSSANEEILAEHLRRFLPVLARRREVRKGTMAWYRLHWPRERAEQSGPKLVVPRRAPSPCFALDLSASCVSSDCTYLVAPDSAQPIRYLVTLMVVLNSPLVERYLRHFGKAKGRQLEFYSQPLRSLPVPLTRDAHGHLHWIDGLVDPELRAQCQQRIDRICGELGVGVS